MFPSVHSLYRLKPVGHVHKPIAFGNTTQAEPLPEKEAKTPLIKPSVPKLSWPKRLFNSVLGIAPFANLAGGLCLITGASLPTMYHATHRTPQGVQTEKTDAASQATLSQATLPKEWEDLRKGLIQMGWTITSLSAMAGNFNGIALGMTYKQPSMVLASLGGMAICPFLIMDPSVSVRTAMMLLGAPWLAGMANRFRNESSPNTPVPLEPDLLEYDLTWLWKPDELKAWAKAENIHGNTGLLWGHYAAHGVGMVLKDQVRLFDSVGHGFGQLFKKKSPKQNETPSTVNESTSLLTNSELHSRLGGVFYVLGGVPMLFLGGDAPLVNAIGSKLIGAAGFLGDSALFVKAVREKDGKLLLGIPVRNLGGAWFHTDLGAGVSYVGRSIVQQHFRQEVMKTQKIVQNKTAQPTEPPQQKAPSKS
jgi:hypothetical protein